MCWISSSARRWFALGVVRASKIGASGLACGVRQVLRTMVARSENGARNQSQGTHLSSLLVAFVDVDWCVLSRFLRLNERGLRRMRPETIDYGVEAVRKRRVIDQSLQGRQFSSVNR